MLKGLGWESPTAALPKDLPMEMETGDLTRIQTTVNGRRQLRGWWPPTSSLLDLLRDTLHLYGSKECCGVGECGACTVFVRRPHCNSCLMLAVEADDAEVIDD